MQLSVVEVRYFWWFHDGAIMSPFLRARLRAAWGFCARHAWGHLLSECELRGLPRAALILHEDLVRTGADALSGRRGGLAALRSTDICLACDHLAAPGRGSLGGPWHADAARVNAGDRTAALLDGCRAQWRARGCPQCTGGSGLICRPHLSRRSRLAGSERAAIAMDLGDLADRLQALVTGIGWPRREIAAVEWGALVEGLGWCAGWAPARELADGGTQ